jgi:phosphoenolpyruvate synthase/pyruvate phosphate dikinase
MVIKAQNGTSKNVDLPDSELEDLKKIGEGLNISQLLKLAHLFADIEKKISFNINERWITEATLINCVTILRKQP